MSIECTQAGRWLSHIALAQYRVAVSPSPCYRLDGRCVCGSGLVQSISCSCRSQKYTPNILRADWQMDQGPLPAHGANTLKEKNSGGGVVRRFTSRARQLPRRRRSGTPSQRDVPPAPTTPITVPTTKRGNTPPDGSLLASAAIAAVLSNSRNPGKVISAKEGITRGEGGGVKKKMINNSQVTAAAAAAAPISSVGASSRTSSWKQNTSAVEQDLRVDTDSTSPPVDEQQNSSSRGQERVQKSDQGKNADALDAPIVEQDKGAPLTTTATDSSCSLQCASQRTSTFDHENVNRAGQPFAAKSKGVDGSKGHSLSINANNIKSNDRRVHFPDAAAHSTQSLSGDTQAGDRHHSSNSPNQHFGHVHGKTTQKSTDRVRDDVGTDSDNHNLLNKSITGASNGTPMPTSKDKGVAPAPTIDRGFPSHPAAASGVPESAATPLDNLEAGTTGSCKINSQSSDFTSVATNSIESSKRPKKGKKQQPNKSNSSRQQQHRPISTSTACQPTSAPPTGTVTPRPQKTPPPRTCSRSHGHSVRGRRVEKAYKQPSPQEGGTEVIEDTDPQGKPFFAKGTADAPSDRSQTILTIPTATMLPYPPVTASVYYSAEQHAVGIAAPNERDILDHQPHLHRRSAVLRADAAPFELPLSEQKAIPPRVNEGGPVRYDSTDGASVDADTVNTVGFSRGDREQRCGTESAKTCDRQLREKDGSTMTGNGGGHTDYNDTGTTRNGIVGPSVVGEQHKPVGVVSRKSSSGQERSERRPEDIECEKQQEMTSAKHQCRQGQRQRPNHKTSTFTPRTTNKQHKRVNEKARHNLQDSSPSVRSSPHQQSTTNASSETSARTATAANNELVSAVNAAATTTDTSSVSICKNDGGSPLHDVVHLAADSLAQWAVGEGRNKCAGDECLEMLRDIRQSSGALSVDLRVESSRGGKHGKDGKGSSDNDGGDDDDGVESTTR